MNVSLCTPGLRAAVRRTWAIPSPPAATNLASAVARTGTPALQAAATPANQLARSRPFATTRTNKRKKENSWGPTGPPRSAPSNEPVPANPYIDAPMIMIAEPGRGLTGPHRTTKVLRGLDRKTHTLRVVAAGDGRVPICKVFDLREEEVREKEREDREKEREKKKARYKILEIGWGIAENDLAMKMERMTRFLDYEWRVEVVLLRRKRAKKMTPEECEGVVERIREAIRRVEGAKEAKGAEGAVGRTLRLYVEKVGKKRGGGGGKGVQGAEKAEKAEIAEKKES